MTDKVGRKPHYIKFNHTSETPQACIWFDTETSQHAIAKDTIEQRLTFGWAAYARRRDGGRWTRPEWFRFTTKDEFWAWVERKQRAKVKCFIFCHNTAFDIPVLDGIRALFIRGWKLEMAVIDAPPTILKYRKYSDTTPKQDALTLQDGKERRGKCSGSMVVIDTLNIFRMPLKALGEHIGLSKLEMPDDLTGGKKADTYCKRDVEIIMVACQKWFTFLTTNDLGGFAHTLAGQALRAYRHRFMPIKILIDNKVEATEVSRDAYYGGRTECFRIGEIRETTYLLDVNSMYPFVMKEHRYPHHIQGFRRKASVSTLATLLDKYAITATVTLNTPEPCYPLRNGPKLLFPVGEFTTHLSSPEISYALKQGHIVSARNVAVYRQADLFSEFVTYFYNQRGEATKAGNKTDALLYKVLMNSLYGKFGQSGIVWEDEEQTDDIKADSWITYNLDTGEKTKYRQLGGLVQSQVRERESRESFPAIAAHVTAHARMLLWSLIKQAGRENVYYCDTDSLLVNVAGYNLLRDRLSDKELGALKVEGQYADAEIFGNKDYRFGDKVRTKGVKKTARWKGTATVEQEQWSTLKGLIKSGNLDKPTTKTITKVLRREYTKGTVGEDGYIVPFSFVSNSCPALNAISK